MAARLTTAQREEKTAQAYSLSLRGVQSAAIGRALGISEKTVDIYLKQERARVAAQRETEKAYDRERFLGEQDAIAAESWRIATQKDHISPTARAAHLSNAMNASVNKAKALGLFVERHEHSGPDGGPLEVTIVFDRRDES